MENLGRGKIVNITSIYADSTPPVKTYDYTIAKAALSSFAKSLATEYGPKGIKINNVAPGMTETSLIGNIPERTKMVTQMQTPLRRLATVEDIASVVSALVGETAWAGSRRRRQRALESGRRPNPWRSGTARACRDPDKGSPPRARSFF